MSFNLPFAVIETGVFPENYAAARQRWVAQFNLLTLPVKYRSYECSGAGPDGEPLFTDTAWIGPEDASKAVVLLGGTHGIEGFAGSAVEIDLLRLLAAGAMALPAGTALLMAHALTPWGYAWQRRCDADGVDLNRNIVDFSRPLPENSGYDAIRPALFLTDGEQRKAALADFERQHGRIAFEKAVSAGQYSDPAGPFYGGKAPAHGRRVTEDVIQNHALAERDLAVIDVHTGLGSFGYGEIICDHHPDSAGTAVASRLYGDSVTLPLLGTSSSVAKTGLLDYAWHPIMNANSCYITLEFGSYGTDQLFDVLLRDHQLWAQPDNGRGRLQHRALMRRHFCPDDPAWRQMVLFRARQVIAQAMRGL